MHPVGSLEWQWLGALGDMRHGTAPLPMQVNDRMAQFGGRLGLDELDADAGAWQLPGSYHAARVRAEGCSVELPRLG